MTSDTPAAAPIGPTTDTSQVSGAVRKIVIVGAGFGGMNAARALARADVAITLIDRTNHNLFQPLLYQVATAALSANDIALPIRSVFRRQKNVTVMMGEVTAIDTGARTVAIRDAPAVPYDMLVLATGSVYSWFGHDDWKAHAPALKTVDGALDLRNRLLDAFERAELTDDADERARLLTFVIIGAGPTGVELAGAIAELTRKTLTGDFRRIRPADARIVLCDAGERVLAAFPEPLSDYAARRLRALGIELHLGAKVESVDAGGVSAGGRRIPSACMFWAAGTEATPVAHWLGIEAGRRGLVAVEADCSLPGHPEIFVVGDAASLAGADGKPLPGLGSVAKQQGKHVGTVIAARLAGTRAPGPFRYKDWGQLAMIGGSSAVAEFGRVRLTGFVAWVVWSAVHLLLLVSARNRLVVYVNWVWAWLTDARGARVITRTEPAPVGQFLAGQPPA